MNILLPLRVAGRLALGLALTLSLSFAAPAPSLADQQCAHTSITLYEGLSLTGDSRTFCGNINDLNGALHTQAGNCDNHLLGDNSWDDCASSWAMGQNDHGYCVQIYGNPNYVFPLLEGGFFRTGQWSNFDGGTGSGGEENKATSLRFFATSTCGTNP